MSDSKTSKDGQKRSLPSWTSSSEKGSKSTGKNPAGSDKNEKAKDKDDSPSKKTEAPSSTNFSRLLDGVVFVLSGFVNPERSTLRSQALEMGAEYRPDWGSDCTLLVCAYSNTPKFRQVEADCGTIVNKEWILDCYNQKKLVEIDSYLMHAGKPWRKSSISNESSTARKKELADKKSSLPRKCEKEVDRGSHSKTTVSSCSKSRASNHAKELFSPSEVKKWAVDDLNRTILWLDSQEEKPDPSEMKQIAAEGILICFQDAIDFLEQNQDVQQIAEQWNIVPRAIEELLKVADAGNDSASSKGDLCKQARACKQIYETELSSLNDDSKMKKKKLKNEESEMGGNGRVNTTSTDAGGYDSDETIEMTEEEIDLAYKSVASEFCK